MSEENNNVNNNKVEETKNEVMKEQKHEAKPNPANKLMMAVTSISVIALIVVVVLTQSDSTNAIDGASEVVASGDGIEITNQEMYDYFISFPGQAEQLLETMISERLVEMKAEEMNLTVTDEDIDAEVQTLIDGQFGGEKSSYEEALANNGLTEESHKKSLKYGMLNEKIIEQLKSEVSDDTLKTTFKEQIRASHILVEDEATANEVLEKAKAGSDFAELAVEYSTGPTGPNGGDLGYFDDSQMVPAFSEAAFAMEAGEISEVVQTEFGYHIIKVTEVVASLTEDEFEAKFAEKKDELVERATANLPYTWIEEYRETLSIEINLK
ncbi:peptidylprolyl isomerase [Longirhabdus pacifica]|uniref:peptidylprolyl isomerase n=1 Tax=Longirhabdus pacifica TaxID=2305227 RepID=UPI00100916AF|nr:peptidylprolyl isomerase [Longirhabdus pacifica]